MFQNRRWRNLQQIYGRQTLWKANKRSSYVKTVSIQREHTMAQSRHPDRTVKRVRRVKFRNDLSKWKWSLLNNNPATCFFSSVSLGVCGPRSTQGALDGNKNTGRPRVGRSVARLLGNGVGDSVRSRLSQHNKSVWPMNLFSNDTEVAKQAPPLNLV